MSAVDQFLTLAPVVPVLTIHRLADAVPLARALTAGGLKAIEVTMRTDCALAAIEAIATQAPEVAVGAGTVLNPQDLRNATDAGARFAISPGSTLALLDAGQASKIPYLPAVATPSEIMEGLAAGYTRFKLFPTIPIGGLKLLKALADPFQSAKFCTTGGMTLETAPEFLALSNVICVGGSWMLSDEMIATANWGAVEAGARATVEALSRFHNLD